MYPFVRPNPLQELMQAISAGQDVPAGGGGGYGGAPPTASEPQPNRLAQLEAVLSRPQPYEQQPVGRDPGAGRYALGALADALQTYASMRMGGGPVSTTTERLRSIRERNASAREANRIGEARSKAEGERTSALMEYQRLQQEKEHGIRAQELKDAREAAKDLEVLKQRDISSRVIAQEAGKNVRAENKAKADQELAQLKGEAKIAEVEARNKAKPVKPDQNIAKQQKKAEEITKAMSEEALGIRDALASGQLEPDDVRRKLQAEMDARGLTGEQRQFVINHFAKHIQPILKAHEKTMRTGG